MAKLYDSTDVPNANVRPPENDLVPGVARGNAPPGGSAPPGGNAPPGESPVKGLDDVKVQIAKAIFFSFPVLLVALLAALAFLFYVIQQTSPNSPAIGTADKMALAASVQVAIS